MLYIIPTDTCFGLACAVNDSDGYKRIYEIKGRDFIKPLAVMVNDFSILENALNTKQLNFLKNYHRPWTVFVEKEKVINENIQKLEKIAIRVANNDIQKKLISEVGPIFLTSANLSGKNEIYSISELNEIFGEYDDIKLLAENDLENISPSDIFEFIGDSLEINYVRKN